MNSWLPEMQYHPIPIVTAAAAVTEFIEILIITLYCNNNNKLLEEEVCKQWPKSLKIGSDKSGYPQIKIENETYIEITIASTVTVTGTGKLLQVERENGGLQPARASSLWVSMTTSDVG